MQPPLSYREVCSLPPACPPSPRVFHLHAPMRRIRTQGGIRRSSQPGVTSPDARCARAGLATRPWHTGTPGSCHALPPAPAALSITQSGQGAGGGTPKVVGVGGGWAPTPGHPPLGFAPQRGACRGGGHLRNEAPSAVTRRTAGSRRWHGDKPGREVAPTAPQRREQSLGISFFGRPRVPPPLHSPSSSRARARGHN